MSTTLQSEIFQVSQEIHWEEETPGIQRQVYGYNESIMLVKVKFEKAAIGILHQHQHSQINYVENGVFELNIGDKKKILKKGDGYYVPPNSYSRMNR
jgi:quercetin dioxygenase-like cupin family protein